ncbi:alpha/beta hydrolase, partial [Bordetella avium]|uniref:alpha/beta hydrolase n=1 Tax=Bordetella avium TaxID=521 RepID=UPI00307D0D93
FSPAGPPPPPLPRGGGPPPPPHAYCSLVRAQAFAQDWGSRFVILSEAGHINAESGLGNWPQGLKILGALRRRSVWRVSPPIQRVPPVPALSDSLRPA